MWIFPPNPDFVHPSLSSWRQSTYVLYLAGGSGTNAHAIRWIFFLAFTPHLIEAFVSHDYDSRHCDPGCHLIDWWMVVTYRVRDLTRRISPCGRLWRMLMAHSYLYRNACVIWVISLCNIGGGIVIMHDLVSFVVNVFDFREPGFGVFSHFT